jgi:putative ABC transport system permease protein
MALSHDLRYAVRILLKAPGFTLSIVSVLALGIGANAAVFSALDQTVLRPLPYGDPDRLAMVWEDFSAVGMPWNRVSPATYYDWKRRNHAFEDLAAIRLSVMNLAESGAPEQVLGAAVTANLIPLMGISPVLGRSFSIDEEPPGHRVVVLSHSLWRRRFAADVNVLGRTIVMSGERYTVVGVMPAGFRFPDARTEFWVPIAFRPQQLSARNSHYLRVVGRLRAGWNWQAARDDMSEVARQLAREFPGSYERVAVSVRPLEEEVTASASHALTLLLAAAACVLLIACANVANLLLARASSRGREIAVRLALGATRRRLVGQLLTESLLLSMAGGLAGLIVAQSSLRALTHLIPPALSTSITLHLDTRAVIFTTAITALTALVFGLLPASQAASRSVAEDLKTHGTSGADRAGARLRRSLVIGEVAIALVLVVSAGLLIETLVRLRAVDPGFRSDHILTAEIAVPYPRYADADRRRRFYTEVLDRVRILPGVERAGLTSDLPYAASANYMSVTVEGRDARSSLGSETLFRLVSNEYLQTMGARLLAGRLLDDRDRPDTLPAVVVNETLARAYWPNETAVGRRIDAGTGDGSRLWMTIVGVVEDVKERGFDYAAKAAVYVPFTQTTFAFFQPSYIAVRTSVPPERLASALQRAVWAVDPEQPVSELRTMDDIVDEELAARWQLLSLVGAFATMALILVALGVYSVLSCVVSERQREIGLRIAIGASPGAVLRSMLGQSIRLVVLGILIGLVAAVLTTRWLGSFLFGVSPVDPLVLFIVSLLIGLVAVLASYVPARRAAAVDPMLVLRAD